MTSLMGIAALALCGAETKELVQYGDFEAEPAVLRKHFTEHGARGSLTYIRQQPGNNQCAKLMIPKIEKLKNGQLYVSSQFHYKMKGLKPGTVYKYSFDLTGTASKFIIQVRNAKWVPQKITVTNPPNQKGMYSLTPQNWTQFAGEFKTDTENSTFIISLWHSTQHGKMFYSAGDYVLIDNLSIQAK